MYCARTGAGGAAGEAGQGAGSLPEGLPFESSEDAVRREDLLTAAGLLVLAAAAVLLIAGSVRRRRGKRRKDMTKDGGKGKKDLTGRRFGHLVVLEKTPRRERGYVVWLCRLRLRRGDRGAGEQPGERRLQKLRLPEAGEPGEDRQQAAPGGRHLP